MGSAVIQSLMEQRILLKKRFGINIHIRGIANSRSMLLGDDLGDDLIGEDPSLHTLPPYPNLFMGQRK